MCLFFLSLLASCSIPYPQLAILSHAAFDFILLFCISVRTVSLAQSFCIVILVSKKKNVLGIVYSDTWYLLLLQLVIYMVCFVSMWSSGSRLTTDDITSRQLQTHHMLSKKTKVIFPTPIQYRLLLYNLYYRCGEQGTDVSGLQACTILYLHN